jgi:hypothetical protein
MEVVDDGTQLEVRQGPEPLAAVDWRRTPLLAVIKTIMHVRPCVLYGGTGTDLAIPSIKCPRNDTFQFRKVHWGEPELLHDMRSK